MIELIYMFVLFLLAIGPPFLMLFLIWYFDKLEREPKKLMFLLFLVGMVSCFPIAFAELFLDLFNFFPENSFLYHFFEMFFIVGLCEELGKFAILFLCTWFNKNFSHKYDAIVYSVAVSLGFATLENVMYVLSSQIEDGSGLFVAILRSLLSIPGHCSFAIFMGVFYGLAKAAFIKKEQAKGFLYIGTSIIMPILLHGFFDFCLSIEGILIKLVFLLFIAMVDTICIVLIYLSVKNDTVLHNNIQNSMFFGGNSSTRMLYNRMYQSYNPTQYIQQPMNYQPSTKQNNTYYK